MRLTVHHRGIPLILSLFLAASLSVGCGRAKDPAPAPEAASVDATEAAQAAETEAAPEEPKLTTETAKVGICLAKTEYGDNERLAKELPGALVQHGFLPENILEGELTGSRSRQEEEIESCLEEGCSLLVVSAVDDARIPGIADRIASAGACAVFVNCAPGGEEVARWSGGQMGLVWIGTTRAEELACQMGILYDLSGGERGVDFNQDGHLGAVLVGGGEEARARLEETVRDLGTELQILGETDAEDPEEISLYVQEVLNGHRKEAELILCASESALQAAADGVQLRHRLVGRDILVIGTGAHEETCTGIINKLISGSVFTDFYEQANLAAVAAKDLVEGNQEGAAISDVIFKVTEDNAQEVLDQLWRTGGAASGAEDPGDRDAEEESTDGDDEDEGAESEGAAEDGEEEEEE